MCERCADSWPGFAWPPRTPWDPRNGRARSRWRSVLADPRSPARWATWVQTLGDARGVYLIRDAKTQELLYVGESHRGQRLKKTLTRHFWRWEGRGAGPTYEPSTVEVAVELYDDPNRVVERQYELIRALKPSDNITDGHTLFRPSSSAAATSTDDEVPF